MIMNSFQKFSNHLNFSQQAQELAHVTNSAQTHAQILALHRGQAKKFKANTSIEEQINSTGFMPEIAESVASKEDDNEDEFNLDM